MKKQDLGFTVDTLLKVSEVIEFIKAYEIIDPIPTHQTIINWILDGTFKGKAIAPKRSKNKNKAYGTHYYVRKSSLIEWAKEMQEDSV